MVAGSYSGRIALGTLVALLELKARCAEAVTVGFGSWCASLALRDEAAHWLVERGIDQWSPGEVPRSWIERRVEDGWTFLLLRPGSEPMGTVTVLWSDELVWGDDGGDAGYVHMLIVTPRLRGTELGGDLLGWAETHVAERGRPACRLDCTRSNRRLRQWYEEAGYVHVGDQEFAEPSWARAVALYEKRLQNRKAAPAEEGGRPSVLAGAASEHALVTHGARSARRVCALPAGRVRRSTS